MKRVIGFAFFCAAIGMVICMDDARDFVFSYNAVSWICDSGIYIIL